MINETLSNLVLFFVSFFSNFISSLAGGGAGIIQLPALLLIGIPFSSALATHKLASVALGFGASLRHSQEERLKYKFILLILLSGIPGVFCGSFSALSISNQIGSLSLGTLTIVIGFFSKVSSSNSSIPRQAFYSPVRVLIGCFGIFLIGFLNGFLSSGTGLLVTIWLVRWFRFSYAEAIKYTLILVGFFWNLTGAIVLGTNGNIYWSIVPVLLAGSFIGGYIGAHFSIVNSERLLKSIFEVVTFTVGILLIVKSFTY